MTVMTGPDYKGDSLDDSECHIEEKHSGGITDQPEQGLGYWWINFRRGGPFTIRKQVGLSCAKLRAISSCLISARYINYQLIGTHVSD